MCVSFLLVSLPPTYTLSLPEIGPSYENIENVEGRLVLSSDSLTGRYLSEVLEGALKIEWEENEPFLIENLEFFPRENENLLIFEPEIGLKDYTLELWGEGKGKVYIYAENWELLAEVENGFSLSKPLDSRYFQGSEIWVRAEGVRIDGRIRARRELRSSVLVRLWVNGEPVEREPPAEVEGNIQVEALFSRDSPRLSPSLRLEVKPIQLENNPGWRKIDECGASVENPLVESTQPENLGDWFKIDEWGAGIENLTMLGQSHQWHRLEGWEASAENSATFIGIRKGRGWVASLGKIYPGGRVSAEFGGTVRRISLKTRTVVKDADLSVEELGERPAGIPPLPGREERNGLVYVYPSNYQVYAWLERGGPGGIRLYHYSGSWEELPTKLLGGDEKEFRFCARSSGFSVYAVV